MFGGTVLKNTVLMKMPAIACDDGTWLTDTTPMIGWSSRVGSIIRLLCPKLF